MTEPTAKQIQDSKLYRQWGLSDSEYELICEKILNRLPNYTETGLYSVMWSEHCSYKNSKKVLRKMPNKSDRVLAGPGEDAGILDIGDGQAVVFKAESHNHPSAVEPYQGAATGVGGIIRDIFSMGAQPFALLNSLKFGPLKNGQTKHLVNEVVAGIGGYGNCIGLPTVGGEISFEDCYENNPLVNAMCVGLLNKTDFKHGTASGKGNLIVYVGAKTGRDGIHGATFASDEFTDTKNKQRSAVQVGNPFIEKLLMDACVEIIEKHPNWILGIQDMGAAGLVSSTAEMASKADSGLILNLDNVPQRETEMSAYEMMLSESQERMVLCVKPQFKDNVLAFFKNFELDAVVIGEVTEDKQYKIYHHDELVTDIPVRSLTEDVPEYDRPEVEPARIAEYRDYHFVPEIDSLTDTWQRLLKQPNIASKKHFYQTYDSQVKADTLVQPGSDAGVTRIRGTKKAIAMTNDSNSKYVYLDPYVGGQITVMEAARNIVASGGEPIGVTDCLNYGNPENPEVFWELDKSVEGIASACEKINTPVISGNVSLYNEYNDEAIYPSPMIGMVGLIDDMKKVTTASFKKAGDLIYLLGNTFDDFNGSEIQLQQTGIIKGGLRPLDLNEEKLHQDLVRQAINQGLVASCHDLSEGGLAVALSEAAFDRQLGFEIETNLTSAQMFSETQSRFLVTVKPEDKTNFENLVLRDFHCLGQVTADSIFKVTTKDETVSIDGKKALNNWKEAIACLMK
ncbi:phosphoribosylformylglycinamidine synthase subunit PurL [Companilactobacillus bobalius]|uniref:Phosphoribosylformylglycinamidine synthase subunit PurL n=2 Tax=Companilactobacillus bobalius TaxID=2801451 RepID=A0A202F4E0_9LACO|nr:phosphoribosylformylglycinamidine synthase subunit PurL [Companilactobacillus bobalius]KAE9560048.1 phosphoribosylformylglycinamidine synthase [Companilactobacillus bobalius]KRK84980.1 phosphoribosylformylglycinamidine synthase II [Companilactobacillus bobalius DSM 19674]OVE95325.1 Phosphoribosylformylglycinamidine synthase [Companilactobacillus bobalius]GEO58619.1 phosphoribosylformylglycinamidine synthase subunit PurL [Companilactobacillus paralimentarius]